MKLTKDKYDKAIEVMSFLGIDYTPPPKIQQYKKLVEVRDQAHKLVRRFDKAGIKSGYKKTSNGKFLVTFYI